MKSFQQKIDNSTCKWSWAIDLMEEITKLTIVCNITSSNPTWKPKCWPYGQRPHHLWCSFWCLPISQKSSWSKVSKSSCNISNKKGIFYDKNPSSPIEHAKLIFMGNHLLALIMLYCQDITSKLPKSMGLIQCPLPFLLLKVMVLRHSHRSKTRPSYHATRYGDKTRSLYSVTRVNLPENQVWWIPPFIQLISHAWIRCWPWSFTCGNLQIHPLLFLQWQIFSLH